MSDTEEESTGSCENLLITFEWIQDFLKDYHKLETEFEVKNYQVSPGSSNGVSNLSEVLAVAIDYELNGQPKNFNLFIKLLPQDPFSRFFVTEAQFDLREIKFYTTVLPDLLEFQEKHLKPGANKIIISVPKCFHTNYIASPLQDGEDQMDGLKDTDPEPPESILVLQDMRPLGYKSAHFTKGLTFEEAKYAICSISAVHALSLGMKLKEKVNVMEKYPFLFQISKASDSYQQLIEQGLPQLSKFLEGKPDREKELAAIAIIKDRTREIIEKLLNPDEPMGLITHTDFWCNNLLLKEPPFDPSKEDNCVILDWQMVTYSRPTNDIALLLISSLPSCIRRESIPRLLDYYYDCLERNLSKISISLQDDLEYTREKLQADYKKSQLLALLLCIGSVDIALGNEEAEQRFLDVLQDFYNEGVLDTHFLEK